MRRKLMLLISCLVVWVGVVNAQVSQVAGTVTSSEDGLPIVGASVLVKGTTVGTVTDIDGNFSIPNVPENAKTLVVSFIGMKSEEVAVAPTLNVVLHPDTEVLDEVVVTGMFNRRMESFTGSATTFKREDILRAGNQNLLKSLKNLGLNTPLMLKSIIYRVNKLF